jgi:hypothetical protein
VAARLLEGFLGAALLLAAIGKTADLEATASSLARLGLRPALARPVVSTEAAVATALLLGVAPAIAATAAVGLGVAFVVAHLRTAETAGCGCLGRLDRGLSPRAGLARAGVFLAVAAAAWSLRVASGSLSFELRPTQLLAAAAGGALAIATLVVAAAILQQPARPVAAPSR